MDADDHVQAYYERLDRLQAARERADAVAMKAAIAAEWEAMTDERRLDILARYSQLNLEGRLEDGRYFDQWLSVATHGYASD